MTDERRTNQRVPMVLEVRWQGASGNYEARISDLSSSGCYIDSSGQAAPGEEIRFAIRLPAGDWLHLVGQVTYQHSHMGGFGMRFINMTEEQRATIAELIETAR